MTWNITTVKELLQLEDNLDKCFLSFVESPFGKQPGDESEQEIRHKDALTISQLEKPAQRVAVEILKKAGKKRGGLPAIWEVSRAVRLAKEDAVRKAEPEQRRTVKAVVADTLDVPEEKQSAVSETIVDAINSAPTPRKKREALTTALEKENIPAGKYEINRIAEAASRPLAEAQSETVRYGLERQVEETRAAKLPSAEDEGLRIIHRLLDVLPDAVPDEKVQELIACRMHLPHYVLYGLIKYFNELADRFRGYAEELAKPCPNLLTEGAQTQASNTTDSAEAAA